MQSSGGLISPDLARDFPVRIIESGPAAGILMCAIVGKAEGREHVITFDMGGTTAKLGAIDGGKPAIMPTFEIDLVRYKKGSGLPINVPAVEMVEIGAGGGSIARTNKRHDRRGAGQCRRRSRADLLRPRRRANPRSPMPTSCSATSPPTGSMAAPCGSKPTLRLPASRRKIADPLGISTAEAAWGIHLVATSNMENALRIVSVERGRDPRRYAMVAFGGAGPLHAARLARAVGIPTVIVPSGAGVGSAIGLLEADPRIDVTTTTSVCASIPIVPGADIAAVYKGLESTGAR